MIKFLPEFEDFFTVFLKNRNFISKIKRSKVTDYAALNGSLNREIVLGDFLAIILPSQPVGLQVR